MLFRSMDLYKSYVNVLIAEIDAFKNDGITLDTIDNRAHYVSLTEGMNNYDPYIVYDIASSETESNCGQVTKVEYEVIVELHKAFTNDGNMWKRVLRYQKALQKSAERYYELDNNIQYNKKGFNRMEVKSVPVIYIFDDKGKKLQKNVISVMLTIDIV